MKTIFGMLTMAVACSAYAVDYPIITVETDSGTLDAPLRLDEMSVSYAADAETPAETVTFASLGKPTAGTFRKRGSGFVMSSASMTNFTGTVLIEEGAMCCEGPGAFGPANNTAGPMVISNGASLVVAGRAETMVAYGMQVWNPITAEGTGVNGIGAIYNKSVGPSEKASVFSREALKGGLTLAGDMLIGSVSASELGDDSDHKNTYPLNGHTLTISGGKGILVNGANIQPGHIVLTNSTHFRIQSGFTLVGGATNVFKVCKGSLLDIYNGGNFSAPWTLLFEDGAKINASGKSDSSQIANLSRHQWKGPICVNGCVTLDGINNEGFTLLGPVTGEGGFTLTRGYLSLTNGLNDFRGPVTIRPTATVRQATLGLWSSNAWPQANMHPIVSTNGTIYFGKKTNYNLPQIIWHSTGNYSNSYMYGTATYLTMPGIIKSGSRVLEIPGQLNATNRTELRAGTLRLAPPDATQYSLQPGVWESVTKWGDTSPGEDVYKAYYTDGTRADTNGVQSALRYCQKTGTSSVEPDWDKQQVARYEGYIWNRSSETQRWSLAMTAIQGKLYLDDNLVLQQHNTWYWLATNTISVAPGPHKFDIRFRNRGYGTGGAKPAYRIANGLTGEKMIVLDPVGGTNVYESLPETWPNNFGFGIDVQGRSSLYSKDYVKPANSASPFEGFADGGDGAWFTLTTNTVAQGIADGSFAAAHLRSSFDTLSAWDGTTLDLGGGDVFVKNLEGFTHVTNGTLRITGAWTLDVDALLAGAKLTLDNHAKVIFGADTRLDVDDATTWRRRLHGTEKTMLAAEALEGEPILSEALTALGVRLVKTGTTYTLNTPALGTVILLR